MDLSRLEILFTEEDIQSISNINLLIVGIGGVGGYALEGAIRMGIKNITIIDNDTFKPSNMNRQLLCLESTINESKVDVAIKRAKEINPFINIKGIHQLLINPIDKLTDHYDYIIDACDTVTTKLNLIKYAITNNSKIITCLGTGNRMDPTKLEITSINKTNNDPLAKVLRKLLKDNNLPLNTPCVWSREIPVNIGERTPHSCVLVPSVAGMYCISYVINDCIKK